MRSHEPPVDVVVRQCPVCESAEHVSVLTLRHVPVLMNAQVAPEHSAEVPRGCIDLVICADCGHLFNRAFDASVLGYDAAYENTLHFSEHYNRYATELAMRLVRDHQLDGGRVVELGSGPGHFLSMLCELGVADGRGYDPSYDGARLGSPSHPNVTISARMFPTTWSEPVNMAFSQHVLEHLLDPVAALEAQRRAVVGSGGVVYAEVPNGSCMIRNGALWDLVYEHVSYFTPTSLSTAFARAGLRAANSGASYGDQFLWLEARASSEQRAEPTIDRCAVEAVMADAIRFGNEASAEIERARDDLARWTEEGPVVLWGAGSKGMTYLNLMTDVSAVAGVVDINPRKADWGVPGTSLVISRPAAIAAIQPSTVVVANPVYVAEVTESLASLGVRARVAPLWNTNESGPTP